MEWIIESLSTFGIPLTVTAILLGLFIIFAKKWIDNKMLSISNFNKMMMDYDREKKKMEMEHQREQFNINLKNSQIINEKMQELRIILNACLVARWELHNGGLLRSGLHFQRFSVISVKRKPSASLGDKTQWKDTPLSTITHFISKLHNDGRFFYPDIKEIETEDNTLYHIINDQGIGSIYALPLTDINDSLIGFISVEYCNKDSRKLTDEEIKVFEDITSSINKIVVV